MVDADDRPGVRLWDQRIDFKVAAEFKKTFSRNCKPHFIGVWDTVGSLGWVYNAVHFPFTRATKNPDLHIVRHALSIDERRAFFRRNVFGPPHDAQQDILEVWFAGFIPMWEGAIPNRKVSCQRLRYNGWFAKPS
jgi:uncharacterized protein (DUF2235 family)